MDAPNKNERHDWTKPVLVDLQDLTMESVQTAAGTTVDFVAGSSS